MVTGSGWFSFGFRVVFLLDWCRIKSTWLMWLYKQHRHLLTYFHSTGSWAVADGKFLHSTQPVGEAEVCTCYHSTRSQPGCHRLSLHSTPVKDKQITLSTLGTRLQSLDQSMWSPQWSDLRSTHMICLCNDKGTELTLYRRDLRSAYSACCHTDIEVADQTSYLTQSQCTDTGPASPSVDPIMAG